MSHVNFYPFIEDGIEILDFFKNEFAGLIDPNIVSIKCNKHGVGAACKEHLKQKLHD